MDSTLELRNPEKVFFPLALRGIVQAVLGGASSAALASQLIKEGKKGVMKPIQRLPHKEGTFFLFIPFILLKNGLASFSFYLLHPIILLLSIRKRILVLASSCAWFHSISPMPYSPLSVIYMFFFFFFF